MTGATRHATVDVAGRAVPLPCEVRDASAGSATFLVDARVARSLLPSGLSPVIPLPGRALLVITMIDYRDNDLGDYDELSIALVVRRRGARATLRSLAGLLRGDLATWILQLPVDQPFSCSAGREIWGFPKTVEDLGIRREDGSAICVWRQDGTEILRLRVPVGAGRDLPVATLHTYTRRDGELNRTAFVLEGQDARLGLGGAELWLAEHPTTADLRALGLPRRAVATTWIGRMRGRFGPPESLSCARASPGRACS